MIAQCRGGIAAIGQSGNVPFPQRVLRHSTVDGKGIVAHDIGHFPETGYICVVGGHSRQRHDVTPYHVNTFDFKFAQHGSQPGSDSGTGTLNL